MSLENEYIRKFLAEDTLWEMTNLRKSVTGLKVNISVQFQPDDQKKYPHDLPRVKFQNNTSDRVTSRSDLIFISIADNPEVLINKPYDKKIFDQVRSWVILNKDALLAFWNQDIDEEELKQRLRRVED